MWWRQDRDEPLWLLLCHGEQRGDELDKVDANRSSKGTVVEAICDIAPIIRQSPLDVLVHSKPWPEGTIPPPSPSVVKVVWVRFLRRHFSP